MSKRYVYFCSCIDCPDYNQPLLFREYHRAQLDGINIFESKEMAIRKAVQLSKKAKKKYPIKYVDYFHIYECDTKKMNSSKKAEFITVATVRENGKVIYY